MVSNISYSAEKEAFNLSDLFDKIDNKTDYIQSVLIDVKITDTASSTTASLAVKSPDKFSIIYGDASNKVLFDGITLWLYIDDLKEAYYHNFGEKSFFSSSLSFIYPGAIFKKLTKATLMAFFDVSPVKIEDNKDGSKYYIVKFVPKFESLAKKVFTIYSFHVFFSNKSWLPEKVIEYDPNGKIANTLEVLQYKINDEINDSNFKYTKPVGVAVLPLVAIIAEKIELYLENMTPKVTDYFRF